MVIATKPSVSPEFASIVADLARPTLGTAWPTSASGSRLDISEMASDVLRRRLHGTAELEKLERAVETTGRYIVAPITAQQASGPVVRTSLRSIHDTLGSRIMRSPHEEGPKVMELTPTEAALLKERYAGIVVERDLQHRPAVDSPLVPDVEPIAVPASSRVIVVSVSDSGGNAVSGARVVLQPKASVKRGYRGQTNGDGVAMVPVNETDHAFELVTVVPSSKCWSRVRENVPATGQIDIKLDRLTPNGFDWGHLCCDAAKREPHRGKGIRIAIIDSGIARHPSLNATSGRNFINGESADDWWNDASGHGTHCGGVIAAVAGQSTAWGYAPEAELAALRIFGGADGGGYASDIGDAIQWAIDNGCDIVSMSFVHEEPSAYVRQKIEKAIDAGVLLVAAAGNEGGDVRYPAKFRHVAGVSAIGKFGAYPPDSIHPRAETTIRSADGQFYVASFSNRGADIDFCAPGVAVTSTYPADVVAALDGTSMACPQIVGIAALALNIDGNLASMKRGPERAAALLDKLREASHDLGLSRELQGSGMPLVSRL